MYLVVKFEECIVNDEVVPLEPLEQVADDGEPIDHSGCHGGAVLGAVEGTALLSMGSLSSLKELPLLPFPQRSPAQKSETRASLRNI